MANTCRRCGADSWYQTRGTCDLCGPMAVPERLGPSKTGDVFKREGRPPRGRIWDKKQHKYIS